MPPKTGQPRARAVGVVDGHAGVRVGDRGDVGDRCAWRSRCRVCQAGLASYAEQPLPAPRPRATRSSRGRWRSRVSEVPPTAVTYGEAAGYSTP